MQRLITAGSSFADTTTTGTLGYCARRYIRPEKPRTPGIERSSSTRSMSPARSSSAAASSNDPASAMSRRRTARTAPRATRRGTAGGRRRSRSGRTTPRKHSLQAVRCSTNRQRTSSFAREAPIVQWACVPGKRGRLARELAPCPTISQCSTEISSAISVFNHIRFTKSRIGLAFRPMVHLGRGDQLVPIFRGIHRKRLQGRRLERPPRGNT